jgi:hypothetical protein
MRENTLNDVVKAFKSIIKQYEATKPDCLEANYYKYIVEYLLLEQKYPKQVADSGKPIYHYFKYQLPMFSTDYFLFLYNTHNPVRFAVETFDSIEEIRLELGRRP